MFSMLNSGGRATPDLYFENDSSESIFVNSFSVNPLKSGSGVFNVSQGSIFGDSGAFTFGNAVQPGGYLGAFGFDGFFNVDLNTFVGSSSYDLEIDILGGADASAADVLYTLSMTVETVDSFGISYTAPNPTRNLTPGQSTVLTLDSVNTSNRDFRINSMYYSWGGPGRDSFDISFLDSGQFLPSNSSVSRDHLVASPKPNTAGDSFTFRMGYYGGYYSDDFNFLPGSNEVTLNSVVPEPASMIALSMAAGGLFLRRRKG